MEKDLKNLDIIVLGASGNLAKTKIFPALFALFSQGLLPEEVKFFGFARSQLSQDEFKEQIMRNLTCRYTPVEILLKIFLHVVIIVVANMILLMDLISLPHI